MSKEQVQKVEHAMVFLYRMAMGVTGAVVIWMGTQVVELTVTVERLLIMVEHIDGKVDDLASDKHIHDATY